MGSDIEILGGGAVAVDTETLRAAAARFVIAGDHLAEISHRLGALENMLLAERAEAWEALSSTYVLGARLRDSVAGATRVASALREAAAVYELVELNAAHHAAVLAGDREAEALIAARRDALTARYPDAMGEAVGAGFERAVMWPSDLVRQATETGLFLGDEIDLPWGIYLGAAAGLGTIGLGAVTGLSGAGRLSADARLQGAAEPVALTPVTPAGTTTTAPPDLAAAARRVPTSGASRVRVEAYTMTDGSRQYAVYVAGMRSGQVGGRDPWDNLSNVQLYSGHTSSSYEATVAALEAAGAQPGDVVHAFGHSQGAMITAHLALEGGYDTRTHVTFGSPVEADVGPTTLSVGVRHTDDPVAALAGGGSMAPVGAAGSFVVEREADPVSGIQDVKLPAHHITAYAETAALVDASTDPRVDELRAVFAELDGAVAVEVTEYGASRTDG